MPVSFDSLTIGKEYDRPELAEIWGYEGFQAIAKGVVTPRETPFIILFITKEKQSFLTQYADSFDDGILEIEGETSHMADNRIAEASGDEIHLFYRDRHHTPFVYHGQVFLTGYTPHADKPSHFRFATDPAISSVDGGWSEVYELGDLIDLPSDAQDRYDEELAAAITASSKLSDAALRKRLSSASKLPEKVQIISVGYRRNSDVIVSVLRRADGVCERCGSAAPFLRRSDGAPYLEVHHWIPLSQGGEDTPDNAAALCPNCHREVHHGQTNSGQEKAGWHSRA